jgi:hypothetical protein
MSAATRESRVMPWPTREEFERGQIAGFSQELELSHNPADYIGAEQAELAAQICDRAWKQFGADMRTAKSRGDMDWHDDCRHNRRDMRDWAQFFRNGEYASWTESLPPAARDIYLRYRGAYDERRQREIERRVPDLTSDAAWTRELKRREKLHERWPEKFAAVLGCRA